MYARGEESRVIVWEYAADDASRALEVRAQFAHAVRTMALACGDVGAEIVFSELVSNVVKHAPGPISVKLELRDDEAFLRVYDCGPGFLPHIAVPTDLYSESGRGLFLALQFCSELKVEIGTKHGTCVIAVFALISTQNAACTAQNRVSR